MKKILTLLLLLSLIECNNDIDENEKELDSLNGTTWVYSEKENGKITFQVTILFAQSSYTYEGFEYEDEISGSGTYVYEKPIVTLTENGETNTCTISGDRMTANNEDAFVYIRVKNLS